VKLITLGTTVTCTALDAAWNTRRRAITVIVLGADKQITRLSGTISSLDAPDATRSALTAAWDSVELADQNNSSGGRCGALDTFRELVHAERVNGGLTPAQATMLRGNATRIANVLACGS
jgi:hypothetical protein